MPTPLTRALALLLTAVVALAAAADILRGEEIPATSSLPPIFNGRDLTGWTPPAEAHWKVVDGILVGENDAEKKGSMLYTEKAYGDVILEGEVRFEGEIDSGFMLRKPELQLQIGVTRSLKVGDPPLVTEVVLLGNLRAQRLADEPDRQSENDDCD